MRAVHIRTGAGGTGLTLATVCFAALVLPACTKQTPVAPSADVAQSPPADTTRASESKSALNWAREALQRNPTIEVVATDTNAGVFTLHSKETGEVYTVKLNELAAVPVASLAESARTASAPTPEPATAAPPPEETAPKSHATHAAAASTPNATPSTAQSSTPSGYKIERSDGQVKVSGPGVSIVSAGGGAVSATAGTTGQMRDDPIVCEGRRMLHFDNRNIYVDGDAIVARGGCELFITNSRVAASGTGIVVNDAVVHISNSTIEGNAAPFDASNDAKVFVRSSTFGGLPRLAERAVVQDQGGNRWR